MITIKVNRKVLFKGEAGEWMQKTPAEFTDAIKPSAKPEPWMRAILVILAPIVMMGQSVKISVVTGPGKWTMEVVQP